MPFSFHGFIPTGILLMLLSLLIKQLYIFWKDFHQKL